MLPFSPDACFLFREGLRELYFCKHCHAPLLVFGRSLPEFIHLSRVSYVSIREIDIYNVLLSAVGQDLPCIDCISECNETITRNMNKCETDAFAYVTDKYYSVGEGSTYEEYLETFEKLNQEVLQVVNNFPTPKL